jgi:lysophospholipase L1-like esterase
MTAARTAVGANCQIYVIIPFGGFMRGAITTAFNAYQTANPSDTKIKLIDLGNDGQKGVTDFALGISSYSVDGIHPSAWNHGRLAAMIASQINNLGSTTINAINQIRLNFSPVAKSRHR